MKVPDRKTGKNKPAILLVLVAVVIIACLVFLAPSTRGYFFKGQFPEAESDQRLAKVVPGQKSGSGRHRILDRRYDDLAVSFTMNSLYARPLEIVDMQSTARILAADLGLEEKTLVRDLRSERGFVWLGRRLPNCGTAEILIKKIGGVYAVEEAQRFYPAGRSGAHVLGFIEDDTGLAGVEFQYDNTLGRGRSGIAGERLSAGGHLVLTLDLKVQRLLENRLAELMEQTGSGSATGILMDYRSGAIWALANLPDFDPNYYWDSKEEVLANRAVDDEIDHRGWQKVFGFVSAYERELSDSQEQMEVVRMGLQLTGKATDRTRDRQWFSRDGDQWLSPEFVAWPSEPLDSSREINSFLARFGLFEKSSIDLPEADSVAKERLTPLKLLKAFVAMINGGVIVVPHLGLAVIDPRSGTVSEIDHGNMVGVLHRQTSEKVVGFLKKVSRSSGEAVFMERLEPEIIDSEAVLSDDLADGVKENRCRAEIFGFSTEKDSELVMMISLDGASIDPGRKSPLRTMGEEIFSQAVLLVAEEAVKPEPGALIKREANLYAEWLRVNGHRLKPENHLAAKKQLVMPDLRGLSLRKALRDLAALELQLKVVGSGRVVAQLPPVGSQVNEGSECVLTLQSDN
jgi:cell division protein FtsI (penicillin-binding protein 3)